jgi:hypothetical protein
MKLKGKETEGKNKTMIWGGGHAPAHAPKIYLKDFTAAASSSFTSNTV